MPRGKDALTPGAIESRLKENMNNNGTLRSLYSKQVFGKFSADQLNGIKLSIDRELKAREEEMVNGLKVQLEKLGYEVSKK